MSGIIGSRFNIRGSGLVGSLGTDGQVFTSSGAGAGAVFEAAAGGSWNLIKTLTSDGSDATLTFTDGTSDVVLDATYREYVFKFINIHPETDDVHLTWNASIDAGSNYNVAKTSTFFQAIHPESDSESNLSYTAGSDLAQGTGTQHLVVECGNDNDQSANGYLILYNPGSTVFTKHFKSFTNASMQADYVYTANGAGYINTTSAVDSIQFSYSSGEIQGGTISLYGLST